MKEWVTVFEHQGHEIQFLNHAEQQDCKDYKISPALSNGETYPTIGDAIEAIDKNLVSI